MEKDYEERKRRLEERYQARKKRYEERYKVEAPTPPVEEVPAPPPVEEIVEEEVKEEIPPEVPVEEEIRPEVPPEVEEKPEEVPIEEVVKPVLTDIEGIGPTRARRLEEAGIKTIEDLAAATSMEIAKIAGVSIPKASEWIKKAAEL